LERGKFDAFFMADHLAVFNMPIEALKRSHTVTSFEPFTLLSALAGATAHLGLRGWTISSIAWCRNCSGAGSSGANMRAGRCVKIWGCHTAGELLFPCQNIVADAIA
jgi:hypothetical protein